MIKVLTFTSLYPNNKQPRLGVFVAERMNKMISSGGVQYRVVAPVPWFPLAFGHFKKYRIEREIRHEYKTESVLVAHPRFPLIPKFSSWINPLLMAISSVRVIKKMRSETGDFDVIDAQFVYPDGIAGVLLGLWFRKPVLITARGSDVNVQCQKIVNRAWLNWAVKRCSGFITVSMALKKSLLELNVPESKITVCRNGVDLVKFKPYKDRYFIRNQLGFDGYTILSVGNLVSEKGHELTIGALVGLPQCRLVIIGEGPLETELKRFAMKLSVSERITWIPYLNHEMLSFYYSAADVLVLASSREGMPNVILESLACGTKVIATDVGGVSEVINVAEAGILIKNRTPKAIECAVRSLIDSGSNRDETRHYAEGLGWDGVINAQLNLFKKAILVLDRDEKL